MTSLALLLLLTVAPHRLDSRRDPGADSCPDEQALQRAVAERLGVNPFSSDAARTVTVRWRPGFSAEVTVTSETGALVGSRKLTSTAKDCAELAASTALALALILDPLSLTRPPVEEPQLQPPPPPPSGDPEPPPAPSPPLVIIEHQSAPPAPEPTRSLWVGGAAGVSVGEVPAVSAALEFDLAWHSTYVMLGGRLSFTAPGSMRFDVGSLSALVFGVGPFLCAGTSRLGGCAAVRVGATYAWASGYDTAQYSATGLSVAFALGPYVDFAPAEALRLRLFVNGLLQPATSVLIVKTLEAWRTPIVALQAGVSVFAVP